VKAKDANKDIKDYTIGEIEILYHAFLSKNAAVAAVGAAHAENVDSDSEQNKNEEGAVDESQGGEADGKPAAKKRRIELLATMPAFGVAAAPVT
jgi:hypothetical protein